MFLCVCLFCGWLFIVACFVCCVDVCFWIGLRFVLDSLIGAFVFTSIYDIVLVVVCFVFVLDLGFVWLVYYMFVFVCLTEGRRWFSDYFSYCALLCLVVLIYCLCLLVLCLNDVFRCFALYLVYYLYDCFRCVGC